MFAPPIVLVDTPAERLAQGLRTGVLRINPVGRKGFPDPLVGRRHRDRLLTIAVTPLVDEDQAGVIGGDLQLHAGFGGPALHKWDSRLPA